MADTNLNQFYEELKSELSPESPAKTLSYQQRATANQLYNSSNPKQLAYRSKSVQECERFKENCAKRLLLDIYMKVLPFDPGYADGNKAQCVSDVDFFLTDKKTSAQDYFKSAYSETKAPLLEWVLRSIDGLGKAYMEVAKEKSDEAEDVGIEIDAPPETDDEDADSSIVDMKDDVEYEDFIEKLKKKTVNKIVKDISELINQKREDKEMSFNPVEEEPTLESAKSEEDPPPKPTSPHDEDGWRRYKKWERDQDKLKAKETNESADSATEGVVDSIKAKFENIKKEEETEQEKKERERQDMLNRLREDENRRNLSKDMEEVIKSRRWQDSHVSKLVNGGVVPRQTAVAAGYHMESPFTVAFDYISEAFEKAHLDLPEDLDPLFELAIRESTLNEIDRTFEQSGGKIEHFRTKIRMGNGIIVNSGYLESVVVNFTTQP